MKECTNCTAKPNDESAKFCFNCGDPYDPNEPRLDKEEALSDIHVMVRVGAITRHYELPKSKLATELRDAASSSRCPAHLIADYATLGVAAGVAFEDSEETTG